MHYSIYGYEVYRNGSPYTIKGRAMYMKKGCANIDDDSRNLDYLHEWMCVCVSVCLSGLPRFKHWFPEKNIGRRPTRNREKYREDFARCNRIYYSPLYYYMRRRLNGKEGRAYGAMNKDYREG